MMICKNKGWRSEAVTSQTYLLIRPWCSR